MAEMGYSKSESKLSPTKPMGSAQRFVMGSWDIGIMANYFALFGIMGRLRSWYYGQIMVLVLWGWYYGQIMGLVFGCRKPYLGTPG